MNKRFQTVYKHIRRSPFQALAAVAVLTVTLFIATVFSLTTFGSHQILNYFETRPQVTAFFQDSATDLDIKTLKSDLEAQEFVSQVKFISKQEALAIYQQQNRDDPLLLEMVTAEILPSSLEVSGISAQVLPKIAEVMSGRAGVEEVVYQKDIVESLKSWTNALKIAGLSLVIILLLTSVLIIMVIVGMKIAARRYEIEILNLLGASSWYIKNPFVIEGAAYGITSAIIAWGTAYIVLLYSTPFLTSFLGQGPLLPVPIGFMLLLLLFQMFLGSLIGALGSLFAVRRFLK